MRKKLFFFILFCLLPASAAFAQTKKIDHEEFYKPYRAALKSFYENSYRKKVRFEDYKNGVLESTSDWTYEYIKPDRKRYVEVRTLGNNISRAESIDIGLAKYCRKNDGEWKIASGFCGTGSGSGGPSHIKSETFTVENAWVDGRKVKIYRNRNVYEREELGLAFWQTTFWLDEKGNLLRDETKVGLLEPERLSWTSDSRFEYGPVDLKIEAPSIKPVVAQ
jgi:hypothetical protein